MFTTPVALPSTIPSFTTTYPPPIKTNQSLSMFLIMMNTIPSKCISTLKDNKKHLYHSSRTMVSLKILLTCNLQRSKNIIGLISPLML